MEKTLLNYFVEFVLFPILDDAEWHISYLQHKCQLLFASHIY